MMMRISIILLLVLQTVAPLSAQTFPQDYDYSRNTNILIDAGLMWADNSTFHPLVCVSSDTDTTDGLQPEAFQWVYRHLNNYSKSVRKLRNKSQDGISVMIVPGIGVAGQTGKESDSNYTAMQTHLWTTAHFRNNWYARLLVRSTNEAASLSHYTGMAQEISRAGLTTGEIDQSVIGYRNEWATVEYGRSREIWGPMAENNLLLAGNSPAWERVMIQVNYKRMTYRWFYGFLEAIYSDGVNLNRYLAGRALEYKNGHNLILSLGEVSVIAGPDRMLDWAFLNPLSVHLEIEQNNRENDETGNHSNNILFLNMDYLLLPSLRLSGSFAVDEFQIDVKDREEGVADALGFFSRFAWTPVRSPVGLTVFGYNVRIGTYTMQHSYGFANLISRGELIGHLAGNDADDIALGIRFVFSMPVLLELKTGQIRWGDNPLSNHPYTGYSSYIKTSFPSGDVKTNRYMKIRIESQPIRNISIRLGGHIDLSHSGEDSALETWDFSLRYQLPLQW
ncbi:MAG: hypothetical protein P9L92_06910 [Candidatus Electryonea clarkiae]|nr:hypothetical protein [Candidatus Electryonea clarkiae]